MFRRLLWAVSLALFTVFAGWYTNLKGPLDESEIAVFASRLSEMEVSDEFQTRALRFMEEDTGRQFVMINALDLADPPKPAPGFTGDYTSQQVMARYAEHVFPALLKRAGHPVLMGPAVSPALDRVNVDPEYERWTSGAVVRYRSRRDAMTMMTEPGFDAYLIFKHAALEKTFAYPIEPGLYLGDLRLVVGFALLAIVGLLDTLIFRRG